MTDEEISRIVNRLSRNQLHLIQVELSETPVILGCIESVAIRLTKPAGDRPALVIRARGQGYDVPHFALTDAGMQVKRYVERRA